MDAVRYTLLFVLIIPAFCTSEDQQPHNYLGGLSPGQPADADIQALCDSVKCDFMTQSGVNAATFEAVTYKSIVVEGMIYFVKVHLEGNKYCILKIYKPLPYTNEPPSLMGFQVGKTANTVITFF